MMSGIKIQFLQRLFDANTKSWNDSWLSTKKVHILRVKKNFINRVTCIGRYFDCILNGKLFSSEARRELICLNTKTLCRKRF